MVKRRLLICGDSICGMWIAFYKYCGTWNAFGKNSGMYIASKLIKNRSKSWVVSGS